MVTVSHDSEATVGAAVRSALDAGAAGVVVVDNASADGSLAAARTAAAGDDRVVVVATGRNPGFGAGCNEGLRRLPPSCDAVLFLNPDASVSPGCLDRLVAHLEGHPRCGLVGPSVESGGRPVPAAGHRATFATEVRPLLPRRLWGLLPARQVAPGRVAAPAAVGYVEGACMLARRRALDEAGWFDESFFLYFEELDLAQRLRGRGWTVELCPEAVAEHQVGASTSRTPYRGRPHLYESTARYLRKWRPSWEAPSYAVAVAVGFALRAAAGRARPGEALAYARAARRGAAGAAGPPDRKEPAAPAFPLRCPRP